MNIILHAVLVPLFIINIVIALLLNKLHEVTKIKVRYLTYIKLAILFILWLIYVILTFVFTKWLVTILIYLFASMVNFIICIYVISRQEKKHKPGTNINATWKKCAKDLGVSFKIRRYGNLDLPIIYGYYMNKHYIEIFPYNEEFKNNIFDPDLKKVISVRVFKNRKKEGDKNVFSYERKFESVYKDVSYVENHIEPDWTKNNVPEILPEFTEEVQKIISNSVKSFDKM
jgi:c-di-AMP phosphodiesterase-like protein